MHQSELDNNFVERLNKHPRLRDRMESLLNVVENVDGKCRKAADAEQHVIDELRQMGNEVLHNWAENTALEATASRRKQEPDLQKNGKKKRVGIQRSEK